MNHGLASATIFSLDDTIPGPARREFAINGLDLALLEDDACVQDCAIRWIGPKGAVLAVADPLAEDRPMTLVLPTGERLSGRTAWSHGWEMAFVFDRAIDMVGVLARNLASVPAERRMLPRIELRQTVGIRWDGHVEQVRTRNISQGGIGIEVRSPLTPDTAVQLTVDGLRPLDGTVRWVDQGAAGILFAEELGWQTLLPWLRSLQRDHHAVPMHGSDGDTLLADPKALRVDSPARVREGVRWWNVRVRALTPYLVEFEARHAFRPGSQLWVALTGLGGGPARVLEVDQRRALCEFRLPLRESDLHGFSVRGTA
ncbi:PilZ domain-containing protein [Sphingomonas sp. RS6]